MTRADIIVLVAVVGCMGGGWVIPEATRNRIWPGWLACLAGGMFLYGLTANRGAQWQDSGYFILRSVMGESVNPLGLALTHPLHYWLSRCVIWPGLVEPAFAITLISSAAAAFAVANLFGCVMTLTGNRPVALLVAASLAVANTFWQLATIAETYTLTAALLAAQCWCLILFVKPTIDDQAAQSETTSRGTRSDRKQALAFLGMLFFNGLSLANHNLALLTLPMLGVAALWGLKHGVIRYRFLLYGVSLWLVGSSPYLFLVMSEGLRSGEWNETLRSALFGRAFGDKVLSTSISMRSMAISAGFVLLNFPNLFLPAAICGLSAVRRQCNDANVYRMLLVGLAVHALFAFRYSVPDQHYFFLSTYLFLCLFAGAGFAQWTNPQRQSMPFRRTVMVVAWAVILATPVVYAMVPTLLRRFDALEFFKRNKPYRDDYAYLFHPWSVSERSADRMSREAVELAGETGVIIVEDHMAEFAVRYQVLRDARNKTAVVAELDPRDFEEAAAAGRRIVLVPHDRDHPTTHSLTGTWRRQGDLYLLDPG